MAKRKIIGTIIWLFFLLSISTFMLMRSARPSTTSLTGTITDAQGNPLNGYVTLQLPVPAQDTTTNTAIAPTPVTYQVINGAIQSGPPLFDVAGLQPANLYYITKAYDTNGNVVLRGNYVVTGASFNLGQATPTNITTSQISYISPLSVSGNNTLTGSNTFTQPIISTVPTGTAPLTVASQTMVTNLDANGVGGVQVTGSAPTAGQALLAISSTQASWGNVTSNAAVECNNTTQNTVGNTTSTTLLLSCSTTAGDMNVVGRTFSYKLIGYAGATGSPTLAITVSLDSTVIFTMSATMSTANDQPAELIGDFTILTTGVSGTSTWALSRGYFGGIAPNQNTTMQGLGQGGSNVAIFDTTAGHTFKISVTWSTANLSNTITGQTLQLTRIG